MARKQEHAGAGELLLVHLHFDADATREADALFRDDTCEVASCC